MCAPVSPFILRTICCAGRNTVAKAALTPCVAAADELQGSNLGHVGYFNGVANQQPPAPISWFPPCRVQIKNDELRDSY